MLRLLFVFIISRLKLVDEDVDFQSLSAAAATVEDEDPTVAEIIDERPEEVRRMEEYTASNKWKSLAKGMITLLSLFLCFILLLRNVLLIKAFILWFHNV